MTDYGSSYADRRQAIIGWRLKKVYTEAQKDVEKKLAKHVSAFERKEQEKLKLVAAGKMTQEAFKRWRKMQEFTGKRWEASVRETAERLLHANETAVNIIRGEQFDVFAENANFQAYNIEKDMRGGISFDIYDETTVAKLIREKPELLPRKIVNGRKDKAWNQGIIANAVSQAIIQGESIPALAKRIASKTASQNSKAMVRYARTAMTAAQNSGRLETMHRAQDMGIKVKKTWIATLDSVTRDAHAELDGVSVEIDESFVNEFGEIDYPGDPGADGANTWNCRCTLGYEYPEYASMEEQRENLRYDQEFGETIENMSYEEWADWRKAQIKEKYKEKETTAGGYKPDKYDAEWAAIPEKIKQLQAEARDKQAELNNQLHEAAKEREWYNSLLRYIGQDASAYERFETEEEYTEYRRELESSIAELYQKLESLKAPRSYNYSSDEEFDKALEKTFADRQRIRSEISEKEKELFNMESWLYVQKVREAKELGKEEILRRRAEAEARYTEVNKEYAHASDPVFALMKKKSSYAIERAAELAKERGIAWVEPKRAAKPFNCDAVAAKLSGGDMTKGSCASLAFAYVGQKAGYDVLDFRDGKSRELFSTECVGILRSMKENGLNVTIETARSYTTAGKHALATVKEGKEYYFECGRHAAIVRKVGNEVQYLELQSGSRKNTWYNFSELGTEDTLKWRFGAGGSKGYDVDSIIIDVDEMAKHDRFLKVLGYINTNPEDQHKGANGHER